MTTTPPTTAHTTIDTPIGPVLLITDGEALTGIHLDGESGAPPSDLGPEDPEHPVLKASASQLAAYFTGALEQFDLPLRPAGSAFQRTVWHELARIPYGETISYGELARRIGNASASRAVGLANGRNPLPIVVPCHRVIGADGTLTGYGGGLERKRWLLDHEQEHAGAALPLGHRG